MSNHDYPSSTCNILEYSGISAVSPKLSLSRSSFSEYSRIPSEYTDSPHPISSSKLILTIFSKFPPSRSFFSEYSRMSAEYTFYELFLLEHSTNIEREHPQNNSKKGYPKNIARKCPTVKMRRFSAAWVFGSI